MKSLDELWTEEELINKLRLPSKKGKSGKIGNWTRKGLRYINISGKRFFRDEDLADFFNRNVSENRGSAKNNNVDEE
ncbi:MAG: hypothetical protein ABIH45_03795 [Candidatus Omnitrophota bacterium]